MTGLDAILLIIVAALIGLSAMGQLVMAGRGGRFRSENEYFADGLMNILIVAALLVVLL